MVTLDDCLEAEDICKADPSFQKLMHERYEITDLATVACDPWYYGGRTSELPNLAQFLHMCSCATLMQVCCIKSEIWQ